MVDISLDGIGGLLTSAREAITGKKIADPIEIAKLDLQLAELNNKLVNGQLLINQEEAKHSNVFVAGWRPFIGWVCGSALAFNFIVTPMVLWICLLNSIEIPKPPVLDIDSLITILGGLLGLGTLRTYEKVKNVEKNR